MATAHSDSTADGGKRLRDAIRAWGHAQYQCGVMNYSGTEAMQDAANAALLAASAALDTAIDGVASTRGGEQ